MHCYYFFAGAKIRLYSIISYIIKHCVRRKKAPFST
ncbi:hypothetical protein [Caecibacteroides pullorum]